MDTSVAEFFPRIVLAISAGVVGLLSPGPNIVAVIQASTSRGRLHGLSTVLGVISGALLWACVMFTGLAALLETHRVVMLTLQAVGGLYLIWLGMKALHSVGRLTTSVPPMPDVKAMNTKSSFLCGFAICVSNPKAALTWGVMGSLALQDRPPIWVGLSVITGATALYLVGLVAYALAFSSKGVITAYQRSRRWFDIAFGLILCFVGFVLLVARF